MYKDLRKLFVAIMLTLTFANFTVQTDLYGNLEFYKYCVGEWIMWFYVWKKSECDSVKEFKSPLE